MNQKQYNKLIKKNRIYVNSLGEKFNLDNIEKEETVYYYEKDGDKWELETMNGSYVADLNMEDCCKIDRTNYKLTAISRTPSGAMVLIGEFYNENKEDDDGKNTKED